MYSIKNGDAKQMSDRLRSLYDKPVRVGSYEAGFFFALMSYFIRKVSRSITTAMIAIINIAFSYLVTDGLLHS